MKRTPDRVLSFGVWLILAVAAILPVGSCLAQDNDFSGWFSVGLEKKLAKGFTGGIEAEYRLQDHFSATDRFSAGLSFSYRLFRSTDRLFDLKAGAGFRYIRKYQPESISYKDPKEYYDADLDDFVSVTDERNVDAAYNVSKYRATASLSASFKAGRLELSVRERYQFTYNDSVAVVESKWRYDTTQKAVVEVPEKSEVEMKATNTRRHILRSRLQASYNIPHCKFSPFLSVEAYSDLANSGSLQKMRYMGGIEWSPGKHHELELWYAYQELTDDDEPAGNIIGLGYKFQF
ncbi:MAG: DUF2490 domain-containing protein [Bacteroidaceae bacterium]|nr:DUF2490 domain-containing protein [Bacteroidaceae bacterium]